MRFKNIEMCTIFVNRNCGRWERERERETDRQRERDKCFGV